jgi:hypothetical protein
VLVVGIDELGPRSSFGVAESALEELARKGSSSALDGGGGWTALLTGRAHPEEGAATVFDELKAAFPTAEAGCFPSSPKLALTPGTLLAGSRGAIDCYAFSTDALASGAPDRAAAEAAREALAGSGRFGGADLDLAFVQLAGTEKTGETERLVAWLLEPLARRDERQGERWLVLVVGVGDQGRVIAAGDGLLPGRIMLSGATLQDLTATALEWLGVPAPDGLAGRSRLPY